MEQANYTVYWFKDGVLNSVACSTWGEANTCAETNCSLLRAQVWMYAADASLWWCRDWMNGVRGLRGVNVDQLPKAIQLIYLLEN